MVEYGEYGEFTRCRVSSARFPDIERGLSRSAIRTNSAKRCCAHFAHNIAAMELDRYFAHPDFAGDLLVHHARGYELHDLLFSGAWREWNADLGTARNVRSLPPCTVLRWTLMGNKCSLSLISKGFLLQEVNCSALNSSMPTSGYRRGLS